jgi:IS30 family transposase
MPVKLSVAESDEICRLRASGMTIREVVAQSGRSKATVERVTAAAGGLPPRRTGRAPKALTVAEREEISRGLQADRSFRAIGRDLGRDVATISREVNASGGRDGYRAWVGERRAYAQAARPKRAKLAANQALRAYVESKLELEWSPEQISEHLVRDFPDDLEMRVSHETIYQSIYVQGRGALRKELHRQLRTGRSQRKSRARTSGTRGRIPDMINISLRPAEIEDRAVPGHWEGDLIIGAHSRSAIGTLVERTTRFVALLWLPDGHGAHAVLDALMRQVPALPSQLMRSLTWDQGKEMALHKKLTIVTGIAVYFADPHSPWQRGSNENTNGLLRQYFPKSTDLSVHTQADLDAVAARLNGRPRKTLGYMTPSEKFAENLGVATAA